MRSLAIAAALILLAAPAAHAEYWDGDNLLACLVGKASVEMRHGATAEAALHAVGDNCIETTSEPEPAAGEEPEGDWGDYLDAVYGLASDMLGVIEAADMGL